ncbi:hypothetical protein LCGC14_0350300 [marine sediment metagenome]|uniref:Uncharacterized protein n=1 Tax=marine sediment metagenome TaxID=412755 RepID=A0A0F9WJ80_9ZZZZ
MLWYLSALALMSYPIAELSRVIVIVIVRYPNIAIGAGEVPQSDFVWEIILMWIAYIVGAAILAWRLNKK